MCAEYSVQLTNEQIYQKFIQQMKAPLVAKEWSQRIKLSQKAPIVEMKKDLLLISEAIFPVQPFPNSRLSGAEGEVEKDSADEPQLKRIYERPTWRHGFEQDRCIVPMTSFFEPAYWGKEAGSVMEFKSEKEDILFAAGIKIKPRVPQTGEVNGFSLLTHTPSAQMLNYHHRLLVFLKPDDAYEWLEGGKSAALDKFNFLLEKRYVPHFEVRKDRTMAKGWEKRIEQQEHKLSHERKYLEVLKSEQVQG